MRVSWWRRQGAMALRIFPMCSFRTARALSQTPMASSRVRLWHTSTPSATRSRSVASLRSLLSLLTTLSRAMSLVSRSSSLRRGAWAMATWIMASVFCLLRVCARCAFTRATAWRAYCPMQPVCRFSRTICSPRSARATIARAWCLA